MNKYAHTNFKYLFTATSIFLLTFNTTAVSMGEKKEGYNIYRWSMFRKSWAWVRSQVFYVVNEEIQVPSTKRINDFIVKIKSYVEQEVSFLSEHILCCYQERKENLDMRMRYLVQVKEEIERSSQEKYVRKGKEILERTEKNSNVISLMKKKLKTIPNSFYHQKLKEAFVSRAEVISQDHSNLFTCDRIEGSRNVWSRIKASSIKALLTLPRKSGEKVGNVLTKRMMNQKAQGCNS